MNLASEIWTWQEDGRVYSRLTTNVRRARLLARLSAIGALEMVESVYAYFDDRAYGGTGYEILWKGHVRMDDLQRLVAL